MKFERERWEKNLEPYTIMLYPNMSRVRATPKTCTTSLGFVSHDSVVAVVAWSRTVSRQASRLSKLLEAWRSLMQEEN